MFDIKRNEEHISIEFSSEVSSVSDVLEEVSRFIAGFGIADYHHPLVVLRELLMNAVIHGNNRRPEKAVRCRIERVEAGKFKIDVEDQGSGFDYHSLDLNLPEDPRTLRKRGYLLIYRLSNRVLFNEEGNHVTAYINMVIGGVNGEKREEVRNV